MVTLGPVVSSLRYPHVTGASESRRVPFLIGLRARDEGTSPCGPMCPKLNQGASTCVSHAQSMQLRGSTPGARILIILIALENLASTSSPLEHLCIERRCFSLLRGDVASCFGSVRGLWPSPEQKACLFQQTLNCRSDAFGFILLPDTEHGCLIISNMTLT